MATKVFSSVMASLKCPAIASFAAFERYGDYEARPVAQAWMWGRLFSAKKPYNKPARVLTTALVGNSSGVAVWRSAADTEAIIRVDNVLNIEV